MTQRRFIKLSDTDGGTIYVNAAAIAAVCPPTEFVGCAGAVILMASGPLYVGETVEDVIGLLGGAEDGTR